MPLSGCVSEETASITIDATAAALFGIPPIGIPHKKVASRMKVPRQEPG
jgi:hypothetical protein